MTAPLKPSNGRRVLLIEDEPAIRDIYSTKLRMTGYEVLEARDGLEGLDRALHDRPDIVLLDVLMPEKDGFETLSDLKANASSRDVPVILMTNLNQDFEVKRGMSLGAAAYLVKANTSLDKIVETVEKTLSVKEKA